MNHKKVIGRAEPVIQNYYFLIEQSREFFFFDLLLNQNNHLDEKIESVQLKKKIKNY